MSSTMWRMRGGRRRTTTTNSDAERQGEAQAKGNKYGWVTLQALGLVVQLKGGARWVEELESSASTNRRSQKKRTTRRRT